MNILYVFYILSVDGMSMFSDVDYYEKCWLQTFLYMSFVEHVQKVPFGSIPRNVLSG